ncbi:MAG TPA: hypothetical protein VFQ61_34080 [Polyangiaceae bacterium]|nr:hypothetical protein [Polyangiaceae bacterium]
MPRLEFTYSGRGYQFTRFFEAELRGSTVLYCSGGSDVATRRTEKQYSTEDEAYGAYARSLRGKRRAGYVAAGPAREIEGCTPPRASSALLIDVYFAAGDARFLEEVLHFDGARKLAELAEPWFEDPRPFARQALLAYVDDGCHRAEHKGLVKRLFKLAEGARDTELMAHFLVAFDRLTRRPLLTVGHTWEPETGKARPILELRNDPLVPERIAPAARAGARAKSPSGSTKAKSELAEFTRSTRRYLVRRALRYFRKIGYRAPLAYRAGVLTALRLYRDEHLNTVGRLLSAWGLMHVLYGRSPVLRRRPNGLLLADGRTLAELSPMPLFPAAWESAFSDLLQLVQGAPSRTVRAFALELLRSGYTKPLAALPFSDIKSLVLAEHEEAQVLGVELFLRAPGLERVTIQDWLELLGAENLEVLAAVCDRAAALVSGTRLGLDACIQLALAPAAPLAALGFAWLKEKPIRTRLELEALLRLARAKVASVRKDAVHYVAGLLMSAPFAERSHTRELCDAQHVEVRGEGLRVAAARFGEDIELWSELCESPYPDVRSFVLQRAALFRHAAPESLARVFAATLCALAGASRDKQRVSRELLERLAATPSEAPTLLPLLRVVLMSVHPAERNLGLVTLTRAALRDSELRRLTQQSFPELSMALQVTQ